jgi:hypothetical protein
MTRSTFGERTLSRGSQGEDVKELQRMLQQLGWSPGPVDGIFGPLTEAAVRSFQAAHGIVVDGIVGPVTSAALLAATNGGGGTTRGISMHIGLNTVDKNAYPFPVTPLRGCINDANAMHRVATERGFTTTAVLLDAAATSTAVTAEIRAVAATLQPGDIFFVSYAGHGSQVVDVAGDENDRLDETWVLWDRQLLDDELYGLWAEFKPGVRIVMLSDSCHSGTMARDVSSTALDPVTAAQAALAIAAVAGPAVTELGLTDPEVPSRVARRVVSEVVVDPAPPRLLAEELGTYQTALRRKEYVQIKADAQRGDPSCSVLLISGCQDSQTSSDGRVNGLFTEKLLQVLAEGNVTSYTDLHRRIVARMPARQQPNLFWATVPDAVFEAQQPFTI